jgi:hypothetical protein
VDFILCSFSIIRWPSFPVKSENLNSLNSLKSVQADLNCMQSGGKIVYFPIDGFGE